MTQYFKDGRLEVTNQFVKARNRSIQLDTVETVEVSRPLFFMALALCGGLILFSFAYGDLLYLWEAGFSLVIGTIALAAAYQIGTLTVFSKLTRAQGWSIFGRHDTLRGMRTAIEKALEDRKPRHG
jgi:hypothetical protein